MDRIIDIRFDGMRGASKGLMRGFHSSEVSRIAVIFSSTVGCRVDAVTGDEQEFLLGFQESFESGQVIDKNPVVSDAVGENPTECEAIGQEVGQLSD